MIKFFLLIPIAMLMAGCGMVPPVVTEVAEGVRESWFVASDSNIVPALAEAVIDPTWTNMNTAVSAAMATLAGAVGIAFGKKKGKKK